ncbi:MAG: helix-turn-helix domain-containing protein [Firmicutes bacterium]|nr:helix-turn-helix domain-containing protein [Bacillota bacterium]
MKTPELSIKDIAFRTGFHSESSFCTSFKKYENVTPSQYRKRILM